jgi:hypothetical protein
MAQQLVSSAEIERLRALADAVEAKKEAQRAYLRAYRRREVESAQKQIDPNFKTALQRYYDSHREAIQEKNRKWSKAHSEVARRHNAKRAKSKASATPEILSVD